MRNLFYTILVLLTVYACAGKREIVTEQKQVLPAVEDVVMYEINPRVFALKNAFNVISKHLDSIQFLGVNVVWFMPIYEIGEVNTVNSPYCIKDYKTRSHTDNFGENNVKCLIAKGICRFVPHSSAGGF